jgi:CheY-like chemotaxis protein
MEGVKPVILLLENEDNDVFWFRRALGGLDFKGTVRVVPTVSQARRYMEGRGEFRDRLYYPLPNLIVSDLRMHGDTGVEFLAWLNQHEEFSTIPFVMLSGSAMPADREAVEKLGAKGFYSKTAEFALMQEQMRKILEHLRQDW